MVNGRKFEEIDSFRYIGFTFCKGGTSTKKIKITIGEAISAVSTLNIIWKNRYISLQTKFKVCRGLAVSITLYECESWTLTAETERCVQTFATTYFRTLLRISYTEHKTNEYVDSLAGKQDPLLATVNRRKLPCFGHVTRHNTIANTILKGPWRPREDGAAREKLPM